MMVALSSPTRIDEYHWGNMAILACVVGLICYAPYILLSFRHKSSRCRRSVVTSISGTNGVIDSGRSSEANGHVNGSFFVLYAGDEPTMITAVALGGDLGRVQIFTSRSAIAGRGGRSLIWSQGCFGAPEPAETGNQPRSWSRQVWDDGGEWRSDWTEWVAVGSAHLQPAWGEDARVALSLPVPLAAGHSRAFYVRCTPPEDPRGHASLLTTDFHSRVARGGPRSDPVARRRCELVLSMGHQWNGHLLLGEVGARQMTAVRLTGEIVCEPLRQGGGALGEGTLATAARALEERLTALDQLMPSVGNVNRQLIEEWHGRPTVRRIRAAPLQLPPPAVPPPPAQHVSRATRSSTACGALTRRCARSGSNSSGRTRPWPASGRGSARRGPAPPRTPPP